MTCRICGSNNVHYIGKYKPYIDYECDIHDCKDCGCRFAPYDKYIYEKMHQSKGTTYFKHDEMAKKAGMYFINKNYDGLREFLSKTKKNKFVIDTLERCGNIKKILEVGCSKGYLSAYFIMKGFDITGIDISATAIEEATKKFGRHFLKSDALAITENAPYDAIYHVGTIGCVESPINFTQFLLRLLKPEGLLIFNAPNISACLETGKIWLDTPPPDLVTLFKGEFWRDNFKDLSDLTINIELYEAHQNAWLYIKKLLGRLKGFRAKRRFFETSDSIKNQKTTLPFKGAALKIIKLASSLFSYVGIIPKFSAESGIHVVMKKK